MSHMDTARSTKGVNPICREDRITSDGTTVLGVDNRAGIAILLNLLRHIFENNISTKNFTIAFSTCEETTLAGSKNIELNGRIKNGFIFDSYHSAGSIISSSFGAVSFNAEIIGKAAHSGIEPEKGINAIQTISKAISRLDLGRIDDDLTVNIGKIFGGTAVNVIPERTVIEGEIRARSKIQGERHLEKIKKVIAEETYNSKCELNFYSQWEFDPYSINESNQTYLLAAESISKVGLKPEVKTSWGGSDANSLNARGINSVNLGIGARNPHSNEEYILYDDFNNSFNIALELVKL